MARRKISRAPVSVGEVVKTSAVDLFANLGWLFLFLMGPEVSYVGAPLASVGCDTFVDEQVVRIAATTVSIDGRTLGSSDLDGVLSEFSRSTDPVLLVPSPATSSADTELVFRKFLAAGVDNVTVVFGCSELG